MKALIKDQPVRGATLTDMPTPEVGDLDILVKVHSAAVCGTDIHIFQWTDYAASRMKLPLLFGHEYAGEVVEVGKSVTHLKKGDRIAAETHIPCGHCFQCTTGLQHVCKDMKIVGVHAPGRFPSMRYCRRSAPGSWIPRFPTMSAPPWNLSASVSTPCPKPIPSGKRSSFSGAALSASTRRWSPVSAERNT